MNLNLPHISLVSLFCAIIYIPSASALEQIIRPYQSVRSAGMGGVRITTGLYDENFFTNPARVMANPHTKFTVLEFTPAELTPTTWTSVSNLLQGVDALTAITQTAGSNLHDRIQIIFPAYYLAAHSQRKWALAIGIIGSVQLDAIIRQSYQLSLDAIADIGPAITYGRRFLKNSQLALGVTGHFAYRIGTTPTYNLLNYIQGTPPSTTTLTGDGAQIDFDLGSTYLFGNWGAYQITGGAAIQNILGGTYSPSILTFLNTGRGPPTQNRSYGLGFSALRPKWGNFKNTLFAVEVTDVLNNRDGSIFRLLHLGAETNWKSLTMRAGINQGYFCAGFGLDVRYFTFNFATYGEEMGLNAGTLEDRRYTLNMGFHI